MFAVGGVGPVVSRESRVPALCGGYARAALCGPLVASRPPGDLRNATNPHCIALGPPPVSPSLHRASFQKSARGGRTPNRFYRTRAPLPPSPIRARASHGASGAQEVMRRRIKTRAASPKREIAGDFFACGAKGLEKKRSYLGSYLPFSIADTQVVGSYLPYAAVGAGINATLGAYDFLRRGRRVVCPARTPPNHPRAV